MSEKNKLMNGVALAEATGLGEWVVYGIKKANKIFAAQGRESLIFTGRYSTPAKVKQWLADHPDFVATRVLVPQAAAEPATPAHRPHRLHPAA